MKIQDIVFFVLFGILFFLKKPQLFVWAGITCLIISMPLFSSWVFFSAQRLTWYAAAFFGASLMAKL